MRVLVRIAILIALLFAALTFYSIGMKSGAFVFVLIGFLCESGFWFGVFPMKRKATSNGNKVA